MYRRKRRQGRHKKIALEWMGCEMSDYLYYVLANHGRLQHSHTAQDGMNLVWTMVHVYGGGTFRLDHLESSVSLIWVTK